MKNTHFAHPSLDRQAQAEYASADSAEDDDPDACDICAYDEDEEEECDDEEQNEEEGQDEEDDEEADESEEAEGAEEEEGEEEERPGAQQSAPVTAPAEDSPERKDREGQPVFRPTAESRQPTAVFNRTSPLPEHDEELDDKELIKMIRQLAGLT